MRPRRMAAENLALGAEGAEGEAASMRPRRMAAENVRQAALSVARGNGLQ